MIEKDTSIMINMSGTGGRFAFLDAPETAKRLKVDRITLDQYVRDGRIRAYKGVGKDSFFKTSDVEALYKELYPEAALAAAPKRTFASGFSSLPPTATSAIRRTRSIQFRNCNTS
jgi:hypothetical protein